MKRQLLLSLAATLLALPALARDFQYTYAGQTLTYTILDEDAKTCQVAGNTNVEGKVEIPEIAKDASNNYTVTAIGESAFYNCSGLTSVIIPNSVTTIGDYAFYRFFEEDCDRLVSVTMGNSVTTIGEWAFCGRTGLTSVTIPNSVTYIGEGAFYCCSGLTSVFLGESLSWFDPYDFYGCTSLKAINVAAGNSNFTSVEGVLYSKDMSQLIRYPVGKEETEFTIPNSVTEIDYDAFEGCSGLTSVIIPNSVTEIRDRAFAGCSGLTSVIIPNSVTTIGDRTFSGCSGLTSVAIPNSVTEIRDRAFEGCSGLTSITIHNSVTYIGDYAFAGCSSLTSVTYFAEKPIAGAANIFDNETYRKATLNYLNSAEGKIALTMPWRKFDYYVGYDSVFTYTHAGQTLIYMILDEEAKTCQVAKNNQVEGKVEIPEIAQNGSDDYTVTAIDSNAFEDCRGLISVSTGNSVTKIGDGAFADCSGLTSVTIGNSVTEIGDGAFAGCSGLTSVTIGNSVTEIGDGAFAGCSGLSSVSIGESISNLDVSLFDGCANLQAINVAAGNSNYTSIDGVLYSKNVSRLIKYPAGKEDTKFIIPNSVTNIGFYAFYGTTTLTSVAIPVSVTDISHYAFYNCTGLTSIVIPISVTYIGNYAFANCTGMTSVTIPNSVWYLFSGAFSGCSGLTSVTYFAEYPVAAWANIFDEETYQNATLNYLNSAEDLIETTEPWSLFIKRTGHDTDFTYTYAGQTLTYTIISEDERTVQTKAGTSWDVAGNNVSGDLEIPSVVTYNGKQYSVIAIGKWAFWNCGALTSVIIPDSVIKVGECAFNCCSGLTSVTIPNSVITIDANAFSSCDGLTSVNIPNSVMKIGRYAFSYCRSLLSVIVGEAVSYLDASVFNRCSSLKAIYVAAGNSNYTSVDGVLYSKDMSKLIQYPAGKEEKEFTIPNSVTEIGESAFECCTIQTTVTIPNSVTEIGGGAFRYCSGLASVTIPNSVRVIGGNAFEGCSKLTSIMISNSVTEIGNYAFNDCTGLTSVTYLAENPIECKDIFDDKIYQKATLNYLKSAETLIDTTEPWSLFVNRIGRDADYKEEVAISEVQATDGGATAVYDMRGVKVGTSTSGLQRGIYIANGRKIFVR